VLSILAYPLSKLPSFDVSQPALNQIATNVFQEKGHFMHIGIIGATGNIGQRIAAEALNRGHRVTGFTRSLSNISKDQDSVAWKTIDVLDSDNISATIGGLGLDVFDL
jgi:NADP-dependent 3-hydroxy acid dehydrogenase YdfG